MASEKSHTRSDLAIEKRPLKRSHSQTSEDSSSTFRDLPSNAPIHQFFQHPSKSFQKNRDHTTSASTRPFHFFDMHLHQDLRLKKVVLLDNLLSILSDFCDKVVQERVDYLAQAGPLPKAHNERPDPSSIIDENSLVQQYQSFNEPYLQVASGLHFKTGWETVFTMIKPGPSRKEAIADSILTVDTEGEIHLSAEQLSELQLLRKYVLDSFVTWEFKSLVCGERMIGNLPLLEGVFAWTACEERSSHYDKSSKCKNTAHRINGRLQVTGRQTGTDSAVIQELIENSLQDDRKALKRPRLREFKHLFWTQAVVEDSSIIIISSGNEEYVGIRHRETQTLFLSPLIDITTDTNPSQAKILVACYILGYKDALERACKLDVMMGSNNLRPRYRLQLHKRPSYVESNLKLEGLQQPLIWPGNDDKDIVIALGKLPSLALRLHSPPATLSQTMGGPTGATTWILQCLHDHLGDSNDTPNNITHLFLDVEGPLSGSKIWTVFLGAIDNSSNTLQYSKPLVMKMAGNAVESQTLQKEYDNYKMLYTKGVHAVVRMLGLFSCPGLPNHKVLLLEDGGKAVSVHKKDSLQRNRDKLMDGLAAFHEKNISVGNIMNHHILMDEDDKVALISLASVSFSAVHDDKAEDAKDFKNAITRI